MSEVNPRCVIVDPRNWVLRNYQYLASALAVVLLVTTAMLVPFAWNTNNPVVIYVLLFLWAFLPPFAFWCEHFFIYRNWGLPGTFELYKHGQQVSGAIWAGVVAALFAVGNSDHFKRAAPAQSAVPALIQGVGTGPEAVDRSSWTVGDYSSLTQILAILIGTGAWFLVRWTFQRQFDAAVVLTVEVTVFPGTGERRHWCNVELAAVVKNVTPVGADVLVLDWVLCPLGESQFVGEAGSWLEGIQGIAPPLWDEKRQELLRGRGGSRPMLTRDTQWRLSSRLNIPRDELFMLKARCDLGLQKPRQHVRYQQVISTYETPRPSPQPPKT
jgi:hypothetical protein